MGGGDQRGQQAGSSSTPSSLQDGCGANNSQPTFTVLTENVVCGKSGVTCSRSIKISLGVSEPVALPHMSVPRTPRPRLSGFPDTPHPICTADSRIF